MSGCNAARKQTAVLGERRQAVSKIRQLVPQTGFGHSTFHKFASSKLHIIMRKVQISFHTIIVIHNLSYPVASQVLPELLKSRKQPLPSSPSPRLPVSQLLQLSMPEGSTCSGEHYRLAEIDGAGLPTVALFSKILASGRTHIDLGRRGGHSR